ncbi:MAG: phosphoribosylformylglycinamidine synthase subunit PurS [Cyclobacteriaceae bacterium]|nr:phosphoribosylformylglycinamidine synthase subunit PurS [Cyclobacteriaceae bacterium]MCH8515525.1 phosphoribosylformylglycinamidine synthase subunit PurS [Cyclobacteriaceae bacterium]
MQYLAKINVMTHSEILDPQGKAVKLGLQNLGVKGVNDVRIGKRIEMTLEADSEEAAKEAIDTACKKLLANVVMENYEFTIEQMPS